MKDRTTHKWTVDIPKFNMKDAWKILFTQEFEERFNKSQKHELVELTGPVETETCITRESKIKLFAGVIPSAVRAVVGLVVELAFTRSLVKHNDPEKGISFIIKVPSLGKHIVANGVAALVPSHVGCRINWNLEYNGIGSTWTATAILAVIRDSDISSKIAEEVKKSSKEMIHFLSKK